jgi:hypothetical protein
MISTMKGLISVCALVGTLAAPAAAGAAVHVYRLTGTVHAEGVPGTGKMSVKVVVRNGEPKRLRNLTYRNLPARCNVSDTPLQPQYVPAGRVSGSGGANVGGGLEFDRSFRWVSYPSKPPRYVNMLGKVSGNGKRIFKGRIEVFNNTPGVCQAAVGTFTAKR